MTITELKRRIEHFVTHSENNMISEEYALRPELKGIPFYDTPIIGIASADDEIFEKFKNDKTIFGPMLILPVEWLSGAKSVISFFLPFTEKIRKSNEHDLNTTSDEWLHARIEGQAFLIELCREIVSWLKKEGFNAIIPSAHQNFRYNKDPQRKDRNEPVFISNWSERHAAFAAGLGTFGLSKHIITEKGVCGRFGSVITDAPFTPTERPYSKPYEYCTFCGACAKRCPVDAISVKNGKDMMLCSDFIEKTMVRYAPRYGCGKCQLCVPCSTCIPQK